jgi:hypothetical protein
MHLFIPTVTVKSQSAHYQLTFSSRSVHGQGRYSRVFKCICSYSTVTVNSQSAHDQLTFSCQLLVREDIFVYLNAAVHTNGHGQVTVRSLSAHGQFMVREDIFVFLNASVHTNGHGQVTVRSRSAHLQLSALGQGRYFRVFN